MKSYTFDDLKFNNYIHERYTSRISSMYVLRQLPTSLPLLHNITTKAFTPTTDLVSNTKHVNQIKINELLSTLSAVRANNQPVNIFLTGPYCAHEEDLRRIIPTNWRIVKCEHTTHADILSYFNYIKTDLCDGYINIVFLACPNDLSSNLTKQAIFISQIYTITSAYTGIFDLVRTSGNISNKYSMPQGAIHMAPDGHIYLCPETGYINTIIDYDLNKLYKNVVIIMNVYADTEYQIIRERESIDLITGWCRSFVIKDVDNDSMVKVRAIKLNSQYTYYYKIEDQYLYNPVRDSVLLK